MSLRVDFNLYLITDRLHLPDGQDLFVQVEAALRGGVRGVQLREKDLAAEELLPLARRMRELTRHYGAQLLINREVGVALAVDADGVHLGGDGQPLAKVRQRLGPDRLIGVSTHAVDEVIRAQQDGADFVTFGPVYATPSKLPYGQPVGLAALEQAIDATGAGDCPVFALGGITADRVVELQARHCHHVACIGAILFADAPAAAARNFLSQF